jgi:hypothetical protein
LAIPPATCEYSEYAYRLHPACDLSSLQRAPTVDTAIEEVTKKETETNKNTADEKAVSIGGDTILSVNEVAPVIKAPKQDTILPFHLIIERNKFTPDRTGGYTLIYNPFTREHFLEDNTPISNEEAARIMPLPSAADIDMMRKMLCSITPMEPYRRPQVVATAPVTKLDPVAKEFVPVSICKLDPAAEECVPAFVPQIIVTPPESNTSAKATEAVITKKPVGDIVAHRASLLNALFDVCAKESPRELLNRCKQMPLVTTDYYPQEYNEDEDVVSLCDSEVTPTPKCLDENRFEIIPVVTGLTFGDLQVKTEAPSSPSVDKLFAAVSQTGVSVIRLSVPAASHTLESIETPQRYEPIVVQVPLAADYRPSGHITIDQLSSSATKAGSTSAKKPAGRSLEAIEAEMRSASPTDFADPAIMGCKVNQQGPGKTGTLTISIIKPDAAQPANEHASASAKLKALIGITSPTPEFSPGSSAHTHNSSPHLNAEARAYTPDTPYTVSPPFQAQDGWIGVPQRTGGLDMPLHAFPDDARFGRIVAFEPYGGDLDRFVEKCHVHRQAMKDTYYGNWEARGHGFGYAPLQPTYAPQ